MNHVCCLKERTKDRHLLRIEEIESVDPDFSATQKGRIRKLLCKPLHPICLIGQPPLHARGQFVHDECKFL